MTRAPNIEPLFVSEEDSNPNLFFHKKVVQAQEKQKIKLSENVEFYLVNLLCGFLRSNENNTLNDSLALLLKQALESPFNEKVVLYKKIADTSLYFSGFLQNFFNNKSYDMKYYVSMGSSAYVELSNLMRGKATYQNTMSKIYKEMGDNFIPATDILLQISEETLNKDKERTTLSIYDAWQSCSSKKLQDTLISRGVIPVKTKHRKVQ